MPDRRGTGGRFHVKGYSSLISSKMNTFSKGQKLIANYILSSYDKAAFMTASKLGKTVHVSESTVVRFASELKYDGYPAMQKALQEMIRNKLTSIQRIEVTNDIIGNQDVVSTVMQSDMEKIRLTMEEIDRDSFRRRWMPLSTPKKDFGHPVPRALWPGSCPLLLASCLTTWSMWGRVPTRKFLTRSSKWATGRNSSDCPFPGIPGGRSGHQLCPRAGLQGHRHHRQRLQQHGQGGGLCAAGQERHGLPLWDSLVAPPEPD